MGSALKPVDDIVFTPIALNDCQSRGRSGLLTMGDEHCSPLMVAALEILVRVAIEILASQSLPSS